MPELAEVEYFRKQWNPGLGKRIDGVLIHPKARIFRGTDTTALVRSLTGATLERSEALPGGQQRLLQGVLGILKGSEHPVAVHL